MELQRCGCSICACGQAHPRQSQVFVNAGISEFKLSKIPDMECSSPISGMCRCLPFSSKSGSPTLFLDTSAGKGSTEPLRHVVASIRELPGQNKAVSQVGELRKIPLASQNRRNVTNHDSIDSSCQGTTSQQDSEIRGK